MCNINPEMAYDPLYDFVGVYDGSESKMWDGSLWCNEDLSCQCMVTNCAAGLSSG